MLISLCDYGIFVFICENNIYIYIYIYIHIHTYTHTYIYIYIHIYIYIKKEVRNKIFQPHFYQISVSLLEHLHFLLPPFPGLYLFTPTTPHARTHTHTHTHTHIYIYIYIYVCMYVCMYK